MTGVLQRIGLAALAAFWLLAGELHAASSLLIWPINPRIEAGEKAAALWLENRGQQPISLQVRVMAWQQAGFTDQLQPQQQVVGSPPVVTVAPGKRQMVRLISMQPAAAHSEQAYRVLVDEMLQPDSEANPQLGVMFQMRYSVPLFVFGAGAALDTGAWAPGKDVRPLSPDLAYRVEEVGGRRYLSVHNRGGAHARLAQVYVRQSDRRVALADGLLGYVLPGAWMRWPLPPAVLASGFTLEALINEQREPLGIPAL